MTSPLYVENGVGRRVTDAINLFTTTHGVIGHFQSDVHPEMQRKQLGDEWWIADVTHRGMAILTQDRAILRFGPERDTVREVGARLVALSRADYTGWEKLRCVTVNWTAVRRLLDATGPAALTLTLTEARPERFD